MLKGGRSTSATGLTPTSSLLVVPATSRGRLLMIGRRWNLWRGASMISRVLSLEAPSPFMRMIIHRGCGTSHRHHAIIVLLRWIIVTTWASTLRLVAEELILLVRSEVCIDVNANIYIARRVMHGLLLVWHVIIVHAIPRIGRGLRHETLLLMLIFRVATA
jgi:hypothetical protein